MQNAENFIVYKSSAGSGKTYTLVREYIALALTSSIYFKHILAVTFTNKAANEMKQRVVLSLLHLSQPEAFANTSTIKHMLSDLVRKTAYSEAEISKKASIVLSTILHDYDDFAIRTIDSFVTRIIRTFAHDMHLPLDFEIEMDKDVLLDEAIDQLIGKAGLDAEITTILIEFAESKAEAEKSWHIEKDLKNTGSHLFTEDGYKHASKLREITPAKVLSIAKAIKKYRTDLEKRISIKAKKAVEIIKNHLIELDAFYYGKQGIGIYFSNLAQGILLMPNTRVLSTIEDDKWCGGKNDYHICAAIESVKSELLTIYQECVSILETELKDYILFGLINNQIYQLGVIGAIEKELEVVKQTRRVLHVSEFNKRITDIILKEPVPFIYERTGEKFRNYLIDEFQDTSDLQWKNLLPLISNSLASGHFNMVVGDGKQAIYRFRNGQVEQFMMLPLLPDEYDPQIFGDAALALINNFKEEWLGKNFRSLPLIVEFNNDFFQYVSSRLDDSLKSIYTNHSQESIAGKSGGFVGIEFLKNSTNSEHQDITLSRILDLVEELKTKGFSLKDIVILTRSNIQGSIVARFLMNKEVNVVSAEALLLATSAEVNFIISVLGMLNDPGDVIASASVIIYLGNSGKLSNGLKELASIISGGSFEEYLRKSGFEYYPQKIRKMPLYDLCEEIIRIFSLQKTPYNAYIQFFLEFVNKHTSSESIQLTDLLEIWEEKKDKLSVVVPEGIDAVRIMTIHKAKGLEFPVVIWPFAEETLKNTRSQLWIEPHHSLLGELPLALVQTSSELENIGFSELYHTERNKSLLDMINLMYVAFTRPVERLYILTKEIKTSKSDQVSIPALLNQYLEKDIGKWKKDGMNYCLGDSGEVRNAGEEKSEGISKFGDFISASWQGRIRIANKAPITWFAAHDEDSQVWGNLVHSVLSKINHAGELKDAMNTIKEENQLSEERAEELMKVVSTVADHELLRKYFTVSTRTKSEASILLPDGALLRPDKIVFDGDEVVIMEFKTGQPKDWHARQLLTYAEALANMGYAKIKRLLVYIDDKVVVEEL